MLCVLADDWTGGLEVAALFPGAIATSGSHGAGLSLQDVPARILVTETRYAGPERAAAQVERLARGAGAQARLFLKTDSTLRGNPGAELSALARAVNGVVVYTPANPERGRVCVDGRIEVDGLPLERTGFARDLLHAAQTGDVLRVLGFQATVPVHRVPHAAAVTPILAAKSGASIVVCDSRTVWDLAEVARLGIRFAAPLAGSGGLAAALATEMGAGRKPARVPVGRPFLMVSGSRHAAALTLVEQAEWAGATVVRADAETPVEADTARLAAALARRSPAVLTGSHPVGTVSTREAQRHAVALGAIAAAAIDRCSVGVLLVLGGNTVSGVLEALGDSPVTARGELLPGVTVSSIGDRRLTLLTRPGGFGTPGGWRGLMDALGKSS